MNTLPELTVTGIPELRVPSQVEEDSKADWDTITQVEGGNSLRQLIQDFGYPLNGPWGHGIFIKTYNTVSEVPPPLCPARQPLTVLPAPAVTSV